MKKLAHLPSTISILFHNKSKISSVASLKGYLQKRNFSVRNKYNSNENKLKPWGSINKIIKSTVATLYLLNKILILIFLILLTFLILYYLYQFFYNTEFDILEAISNLFKLLASGLTYNLLFLNSSSPNFSNYTNTFSSNINKDTFNLSTGANNTGNNPSNSQGNTPSNNSSGNSSNNPSGNNTYNPQINETPQKVECFQTPRGYFGVYNNWIKPVSSEYARHATGFNVLFRTPDEFERDIKLNNYTWILQESTPLNVEENFSRLVNHLDNPAYSLEFRGTHLRSVASPTDLGRTNARILRNGQNSAIYRALFYNANNNNNFNNTGNNNNTVNNNNTGNNNENNSCNIYGYHK